MMKKTTYTLFILFLSFSASFAQAPEMATRLRADGKIYMVVAVMLVIFLGVAGYLFSLDRRIRKIENSKK